MKDKMDNWLTLTIDGIQNAFSRLGTSMDRNTQTTPGGIGHGVFDELQLNNLYYDSSLMRRIIDRPARDALKRSFEVRFEDKELQEWVEAELKRLKAVKTLRTALRLSRKNGGAGIVMLDAKSADLLEPAPPGSRIIRLRAHSRWALGAFDRDRSYDSEHWNEPSQYSLPGGKRLHRSRVIRLIGLEVDDSKTDDYGGWGQSWIEAVWPSYRDLQTCAQSLATQMHDSIFNVLRLKNLPGLLSRKEGQSLLDSRIETINMGKSMLRTLVLDTDEQYDTVSTDLSKLVEPYDIFAQQLSADSNIPLTILFGQAPKGWSSTDQNAIESYYEFLETIQEEDITPAIITLVEAILAQREGLKADFDIWWAPIEKPDEKTAAEVRGLTVTTDLALFSIGAMDAEEIRSRHYGEGFKFDLTLAEPENMDVQPLPAALITDAIAKQVGMQKAMICAYPPEEWLARFRAFYPYAAPGTHLTLEFMGALSEDELLNTMASMDVFAQAPNSLLGPVVSANVVIKGVGSFFNRADFCEVLLVEPTEQLRRLQSGLASAVSGTKMLSEHSWLPHVTVAYHEAAFQASPVEMSDFPAWKIDRVCLVIDDSIVHTILIPNT